MVSGTVWAGFIPIPLMKSRYRRVRPALGRQLGQPQQVFQLATEHEIMLPEQLLRSRAIEVGEKDLRFRNRGSIAVADINLMKG